MSIRCQNVEHWQFEYSVVHSLIYEGEFSVYNTVGNVCLSATQLRTNALHFLHFVDHWRWRSYEISSNRIVRWKVGCVGGCRCSPYFFSGWIRHIVLHQWENNICWSSDCILEQRIWPLFLALLDMQDTIINKILLLIILDTIMLTWINHCQIKHRTLVSPSLLITFL